MKFIIEHRVKPGIFTNVFKSFEEWRKWKEYATEERMLQAYNTLKNKNEIFEYRIRGDLNENTKICKREV